MSALSKSSKSEQSLKSLTARTLTAASFAFFLAVTSFIPSGAQEEGNDPSFCSQEFVDFYENDAKIPRWYSCAYHQHQNGVAEAFWARATPRTIIACQAAPWLGVDYWTEAMQYVNELFKKDFNPF